MHRNRLGSVRDVAYELWSDGRGWILVGVASGWFLSLGVRLIFPALLPSIRETFDVNLAVLGLLVTVLWTAYALGQFPGGIVGDLLGEGNALVISTVCSGIAIAAVAGATTPVMLFVATAVFGFSTALFGPARFTILSAIYERRDGTAIGLTLSAGEAGNAALPVVAGVLAGVLSWRVGFGITVPLFFLVAVLIFWAIPGRVSTATDGYSLTVATFREVIDGIADRLILLITSVHLVLFFVYQGFTGFYPIYLVEMKGLSPTAAAAFFGWFFVVGIAVQPAAGAGGDRFGYRPMLLIVAGVSTVVLLALPFAETLGSLLLVTTVASVLLGATPLTQTYLVNELPSSVKGTGLGLLRTGYIALGATGPLIIGTFAEWGYFDGAFLGLGAIAGASLLLALLLPTAGS
ncbi:major facilitator superfamily protein [Natronococcus amylolyticus DSM 10524]|uniref:Major facilitator superfamily protein n=1 Tax=Natronococcus amylolyticus DSM 10524 TaxID=1227497 RepID=L9WYL8_9EURY|nr:MFS transporter [Natronococcus amylolyticus]ELY54559.1 major facilitator superfamily protein [Natronococcus amylolyticus DSM 10524]